MSDCDIVVPTSHVRQSKLTKKRFARILEALRDGNSRTVAARLGGATDRSLRRWMEEHPELRDAVEAAEAEAEGTYAATIVGAAKTDWRAASWWLERRRATDWGRVDRVQIMQLQQQAEALSEELRSEGILVSAQELLRERETLMKRGQKALPPGASMDPLRERDLAGGP